MLPRNDGRRRSRRPESKTKGFRLSLQPRIYGPKGVYPIHHFSPQRPCQRPKSFDDVVEQLHIPVYTRDSGADEETYFCTVWSFEDQESIVSWSIPFLPNTQFGTQKGHSMIFSLIAFSS